MKKPGKIIKLLEKPVLFAKSKDNAGTLWKVGDVEYQSHKDILVAYSDDEKPVKIDKEEDYPALQVFLKFSFSRWQEV